MHRPRQCVPRRRGVCRSGGDGALRFRLCTLRWPLDAHYAEDIQLPLEFTGSNPTRTHEMQLLTRSPGASLSLRLGRLSGAGTIPG